MEFDSTPAGQEGEHEISPQLAEALAGIAPGALQDIAEVIVLHREFPAWAVWLPHGGRPWIAVRPASARVPGPDLPMIWTTAPTAAELAARMESVNAQLASP
ncbi:MAG: hypothetical protein JWM19_1923 [Actinomycetia bacterium]|nr:hypothetical protein [Actinomycetes bacterium]